MTNEQRDLLKVDLCSRLPYGVKVLLTKTDIPKSVYMRNAGREMIEPLKSYVHGKFLVGGNGIDVLDWEFKPIYFPIEALTQTIQLSSYNNGEPFCPLVEMAKIAGAHWITNLKVKNIESFNEDGCDVYRVHFENADSFEIALADSENKSSGEIRAKNDEFTMCFLERKTGYTLHVMNPIRVIDFMHKLHINYRLPEGMFIPVTDEFNPYK